MAVSLITYQDLLSSGLPLSYFAKVCKIENIKVWKNRGIPAKFQPVLEKLFSSKIKALQNFKKAANDTARVSLNSPKKINHLDPLSGLNSAQNLGILLNNPKALRNNELAWLNLPEISNSDFEAYDARFQKYIRQNAARYLQPEERVFNCLRKTTRIDVSVKKPLAGNAYFADLFVCGSLWRCPVCAAKIAEKRRAEGLLATKQHRDKFGQDSILFVTFTYPHHREDVLTDLIDKQKRAFKWLFDDCWDFRALREKYSYVGNIRALEVTHGENNGWHPHVHYLFFFEQNFTLDLDADFSINPAAAGFASFKAELYKLWVRACALVCLGEPSEAHGLDVQGGAYAAEYLLKFGLDEYQGVSASADNPRFLEALKKPVFSGDSVSINVTRWGMEDEVFKSSLKGGREIEGKKSRSPFQLLDSFIDGDKKAGFLFCEYAAAFKGFRQSRWSKGLKARFNLADISDEQAAIGEDKAAQLFALISGADWAILEKKGRFKKDIRSVLLMLADMGDLQKFWAYIDWVCGRDVSARVFDHVPENQLSFFEEQPEQFEIIENLPVFELLPSASLSVEPENFHYQQQNSLFSFDDSRRVKSTLGLSPVTVLQDFFEYSEFRGVQAEIIDYVISGGSGLVLMPTGGGKSLCYQIPMLCRDGLGVVISPLIALMQDQVQALQNKGIRAVFLNSTLSEKKLFQTEQQILNGEVDILYISPERLNLPRTLKFLAAVTLSLFAIDEAHCISQWGHDFRSDYLAVSVIKKHFPHVPRLALTATADKETRADIIRLVGLENAKLFTTSFDRPNIDYSVIKSGSVAHASKIALDFVTKSQGQAGIVYCSSRQKVNDLVELLQANGIDALGYHSGMTPKQRKISLEAFLARDCVMVATIAFGMGIDKPNVRYVLHFDISDSIEAFYQESGRAGRDGLPSRSVVIYNDKATKARAFHMKPSEQDKFDFMRKYCEIDTCRRSYLLGFFI